MMCGFGLLVNLSYTVAIHRCLLTVQYSPLELCKDKSHARSHAQKHMSSMIRSCR